MLEVRSPRWAAGRGRRATAERATRLTRGDIIAVLSNSIDYNVFDSWDPQF
jgi:hypothetical protein